MITFDGEHIVKCGVCGQDAIQRHVWVTNHGFRRLVAYDTHEQGLESQAHHAVFGRIETFHDDALALQRAFAELPKDQLKLEIGIINGVEIKSVKPQACDRRTHIIPTVSVKAFGLVDEIELPARPIANAKPEAILDEMREEANIVAARLKVRFEEGEF